MRTITAVTSTRPTLKCSCCRPNCKRLKCSFNPALFNTLNAIATLIDDEPRTAQRMTAKLGGLLRLVLDNTDEHQVTLAQELHVAQLYLKMEQLRFSDRLTVTYQLTPDTLPALVPNLLQPLIENTVKHGLAGDSEAGAIHIQADRQQERLVLQVCDNGRGADQKVKSGVLRLLLGGIACSKKNARLKLGYPAEVLTLINPSGELPARTRRVVNSSTTNVCACLPRNKSACADCPE
jgi:LytS/YehU family sensor histidine kinase